MTVRKYKTKTGAQYWKVEIVVNSIRARQQGFQTRREAVAWENKEKTRLSQGGVKIDRQITLGEYLDWWHGSFVQENPDDGIVWSRPGRKYRNYNHIRNKQHITKIKAHIGSIKLAKLDTNHTSMLVAKCRKSSRNPNGVSVSTIRKMLFMLKGAISDAVVQRKLDFNPIADLIMPDKETVSDEKDMVFEDHELNLILAEADKLTDRRWFIFPLLAIWTGMRKSEISALQWGDIDLEAPVPILKISRTLEYSNGERRPTIKTPKSKAGSRDIPLTIEVIAALKAYRAWQAKIYWKAKRKLTPDTTLIFNDAFGLVHKSVPQHRWEALLKSAGVRHRSLHKLRHTFTSKLIRTKMRLDYITSIVGHADERTTTQIYSHFFDGHKKEQLEIMQGMINQ
jgi:integrase